MTISRKSPTSFTSLPSLLLDGSPLELVSSFKYLGITLTFNHSWFIHVNETFSKVKKLLSCIYRQFYYNSSSTVLNKLYLTLIFSIIMYSSSVWDPYSISNINKLEKAQDFVLKLWSKIGPLQIILYFHNSLIFLLYPPAEQHPSFYTSLFIVISTFLLAIFHFRISPLIIYILPTY